MFDLDGGRACLDFANTLSSSGEHLSAYADLVAFALQSELITPADADWLQAEASRQSALASAVLERGRHLRRALQAIFSSIAAGRAPQAGHLQVLNAELALGLAHAALRPAAPETALATDLSRAYQWRWTWAARALDLPLWPVARSAAELLVSEHDCRLVRECGAADCAWLFLDTSKNRTRQWCSMRSCGNREKARRHYQRVRATRDLSA